MNHCKLGKLGGLMAILALSAFTSACSDDDSVKYTDVDGQSPTVQLSSTRIYTADGKSFTIKGTVADADGIASIGLQCLQLNLDKVIDIISIYGEPLTTYDLEYTFPVEHYEEADSYTVTVTVTDVGGRSASQEVIISLDADYVAPIFTSAPSGTQLLIVSSSDTTTSYNLSFTVTDNMGLDYIEFDFGVTDPDQESGIASLSGFPMTITDCYGETSYTWSNSFNLDLSTGGYSISIVAYDRPAQDDEVRSTKITGNVTWTDNFNFDKLYLSDVSTEAELTSDVFGVPMMVDHTGWCEYRARYYNMTAGTKVTFLGQKTGFGPVCYGVDPANSSKLVFSTDCNPIVLDQANQYYEITFNTETLAYNVSTYSVEDYMDPLFWEYGSTNMNTWFSFVDSGDDSFTHADDAWLQDLYFGMASGPNDDSALFVQDPVNKHLYYWEVPKKFSADEQLNFVIHNYHGSGWWNYVTWRVNDSTECEEFLYYGAVVHQNYLDWAFPGEDLDWKSWRDSEQYRKDAGVPDNWAKPTVPQDGTYQFYFDTHLGRGRMVRE